MDKLNSWFLIALANNCNSFNTGEEGLILIQSGHTWKRVKRCTNFTRQYICEYCGSDIKIRYQFKEDIYIEAGHDKYGLNFSCKEIVMHEALG